jgi:hypothetical protein
MGTGKSVPGIPSPWLKQRIPEAALEAADPCDSHRFKMADDPQITVPRRNGVHYIILSGLLTIIDVKILCPDGVVFSDGSAGQ